jgi:hypothetical protein
MATSIIAVPHRAPISINGVGALRRETALCDLFRDNELAVLEIGDPQVVGRAAKQSMRDFMLERRVTLFEIANVDIHRHDILQIFPFGAQIADTCRSRRFRPISAQAAASARSSAAQDVSSNLIAGTRSLAGERLVST